MRSFTNLALLPLVVAVPHIRRGSGSVYDCLVIGGGTSGLVVANSLSEFEEINVLVIEAGGSVYNNPKDATQQTRKVVEERGIVKAIVVCRGS